MRLTDCTEAEVEAFYRACETLYEHVDGRIAWVLDTTRVTKVTPIQRRLAAQHVDRVRYRMKEHLVGIAFVIHNDLVRGALTAISWLSPLPFPYATFKNLEDALPWARRQLMERAKLEPHRSMPSGWRKLG